MTDYAVSAFALARSDVFTGRLQYLLGQYAKVCAVAGTNTMQGRAASKVLASRILSDPGGMTGKLAVSFVSDGGVRGTATGGPPPTDSSLSDDALDGIVQAIWNSGAWDNVL